MTLDRDSLREQLRSADERWGGLRPAAAPREIAARVSALRRIRTYQRARRRAGIALGGSLLLLTATIGLWLSWGPKTPSLAGREQTRPNTNVLPTDRQSPEPTGSLAQVQRDLQLLRVDLARLRSQRLALVRDEISQELSRATRVRMLQLKLAEARAQIPTSAAVDQAIEFGF